MVDELFFSPCGMWKVWKNLCNLRPFDSETSHHFKSIFAQLICDRHVSLFQERCHLNIQNKFKIIMVYKDEIYTIILHQKEQ